jgi:hypothetical protein
MRKGQIVGEGSHHATITGAVGVFLLYLSEDKKNPIVTDPSTD